MAKDLKAFGETLSALRNAAGLSRPALLEKLDPIHARSESGDLPISPQLLYNWETAYTYQGRQWTPSRQHVIYLIELFAELLTLEEAQVWAFTAGYTLGKNELISIIPQTLRWRQLQTICADITEKRMATVWNKYHEELYLQRRKARRAFEEFLNSEKRGFVLTGKSGVGKSNFLLALGEELRQRRDDLCVIMYDSARLRVHPSITETVTQDIRYRLDRDGPQLEEIWPEINGIKNLEARQVIFCVDAINEHPQAKALLRQLDELVQSPWPWLKVVFSSRPETWQVIKQGVRLSDALYYRQDDEMIGVTLEPFSYSQQLEDFSRQELPAVYARYRAVFELKTPYEALPHPLRELLRDPLSLWLVAQTYRGETIPYELKRTALIEQYVNTLLRNEIIRRTDLRLLKEKLVPLLVRQEDYSNRLSISEIERIDEELYELIFDETLSSDGGRKNKSFTNLCDIGILTWQTDGRNPQISFKYERFYEYFVGQHLFRLGEAEADKPEFYRRRIEQTAQTPFLWGAVKNALIQEMRVHGTRLTLSLCYTDQTRVKEMMVEVLTDFGQDNPTIVAQILNKLLPPESITSRGQSLRQILANRLTMKPRSFPAKPAQNLVRSVSRLLDPSERNENVTSRHAQQAAIEVAAQLQIPQPLEIAALQLDTVIRTAAVRYTYRLWQNNPKVGFEILKRLAEKAAPGPIPHLIAFEATFWLSLLILFDRSQDDEDLNRLRNIWRQVIITLLGIQETPGPLQRWIRNFLRERVLDIAISITLRQLDGLAGHSIANAQDLEAFFELDSTQKELYKRLTGYLNVHGNYSREQMEQDYLAVLSIRDMLIEGVTLMGLVAQRMHDPHSLMPLLKKLITKARQDPVPTPYLSGICDLFWTTSIDQTMSDEEFEFFVEMVELCQTYYAEHSTIPNLRRDHIYYGSQAMYVAPYVLNRFRRDGTIGPDWLEPRIRRALARRDMDFFKFLLKTELPSLGIELRRPQLALDVVALFFEIEDLEIHQLISTYLSHLRAYYPNEVDEFLDLQDTSPEYRLRVRTNEPDEELGWLIGLRVWAFVAHELIAGPPTLRRAFIGLFERAADCKTPHEWVSSGFKDLINLLYGKDILH